LWIETSYEFYLSIVALFQSVDLGVFGWSRFVGLSAGLPNCPRESDCSQGGHRPSVFRGAVLVVWVAILDRPLRSLRTVRQAFADRPPGSSQIV
jgi:hypothetical protein